MISSPMQRSRWQRPTERAIQFALLIGTAVTIFTTVGIVGVLVGQAVLFFQEASLWEFISGTRWTPLFASKHFGVLPLIAATMLTSIGAMVLALPLGLLSAVYLSEYAPKGWLTRAIRVSVNNLAGVPSIVYGVFGLGFFIYLAGGEIDRLFYSESLPAPTFGTPGL